MRAAISFAVMIGFVFLFGYFRSEVNNIWSGMAVTILRNAYQLGLMFFVLKEKPSRVLVQFIGALCLHQISEQVFGFLNQIGGDINNVLIGGWSTGILEVDFFLRILARFAFMSLIYLPIRNADVQDDSMMRKRVIALISFSALIIAIVTRVETEYRNQSVILSVLLRLTLLVFCFLVLFIRSRFFDISKQARENIIMTNIIENQKTQYENFRESVSYINNVCHDLKKRIKNLQGKISEEEMADVKNALALYNDRFKTGNEALDLVLYQAKISCERNHIRLTCMADGTAISFMEANDIYTLLLNALSNAIEASEKIDDVQKRVISLTIRQSKAMAILECSNFFDGKANRVVEGDIETTKTDSRHHGIGLKSMRYVTRQYDGDIDYRIDGDIFTLSVYIPIASMPANR